MDFFNDHAVAFALICGGVAVGFGLYFTWWLLKQPAGSERMQEISRAIQEGAAITLRSFDKGEESYSKMDKRVFEIKQKLGIEDYLKKMWPPSADRVLRRAVISTISKNIARKSDSSSVSLKEALEGCDDLVMDKLIIKASDGN